MIEVYPNLFVGGQHDLDKFLDYILISKNKKFNIVQAAKDPFHRQAVGYKTRGAPKESSEYLFAYRSNRLILNLVDTEKHWLIPNEIIDESINYIKESLDAGSQVLVHCNMGLSRGPSIAFLYLIEHTDMFDDCTLFESAEEKFRNIYPDYMPSGIREKVRERFNNRNREEV